MAPKKCDLWSQVKYVTPNGVSKLWSNMRYNLCDQGSLTTNFKCHNFEQHDKGTNVKKMYKMWKAYVFFGHMYSVTLSYDAV